MSPEVVNGLFALLGALVGAVVAGAISWRQARAMAVRKELTLITVRASKLLEVDKSVKGVIEIRVAGVLVPTIYTCAFSLSNSGNVPINDIKAVWKLEGPPEVLNYEIGDLPAGADSSCVNIESKDGKSLSTSIQYLNPGESISVRALISEKPTHVSLECRQQGVSIVTKEDFDPTQPGATGRVLYEAMRRNPIIHAYMQLALPSYRQYWEHEESTQKRIGK